MISVLVDLLEDPDLCSLEENIVQDYTTSAHAIIDKVCEKSINGKGRSAVMYALDTISEWEDIDESLPATSLGQFSDLILELEEHVNIFKQRKKLKKERRQLNAESAIAGANKVVISEKLMVIEMFLSGLKDKDTVEEHQTELVQWCEQWRTRKAN